MSDHGFVLEFSIHKSGGGFSIHKPDDSSGHTTLLPSPRVQVLGFAICSVFTNISLVEFPSYCFCRNNIIQLRLVFYSHFCRGNFVLFCHNPFQCSQVSVNYLWLSLPMALRQSYSTMSCVSCHWREHSRSRDTLNNSAVFVADAPASCAPVKTKAYNTLK